jgi:hypothetical protein
MSKIHDTFVDLIAWNLPENRKIATEFASIIHTCWWKYCFSSFSRTGDMKHSLCVYDHSGEIFEWELRIFKTINLLRHCMRLFLHQKKSPNVWWVYWVTVGGGCIPEHRLFSTCLCHKCNYTIAVIRRKHLYKPFCNFSSLKNHLFGHVLLLTFQIRNFPVCYEAEWLWMWKIFNYARAIHIL